MHHDDPADMSTDDRLEELAALLAAGFLRLKRRTGCLPAAAPGVTRALPGYPQLSSHSSCPEALRRSARNLASILPPSRRPASTSAQAFS